MRVIWLHVLNERHDDRALMNFTICKPLLLFVISTEIKFHVIYQFY